MKQYTAQVRMSYYAWVVVEAESEHSAKEQALRQAWRMQERGEGVWGEEPEVLTLIEGAQE